MRNAATLIASLVLGIAAVPAQATVTVLNQWHLGEADAGASAGGAGAATAVDSVGGFNLNKVGTPAYAADVPANIGSNLSMAFNGTTDEYMNSSGVASTLTDNFGIEAWVKSDGNTTGNGGIAYNGNTSTSGWGLYRLGASYGMLYGGNIGAYVVIVPVLVMASGQLAGGLAWLAISGEDAHDLVATAPVSRRTVIAAKIEAVLAVVGVVLMPLLVLIAIAAPSMAVVTALCAACAAGSATLVQLLFRVTSRRSLFRRRQVASRTATICEALVSIAWAGTGALLAAGSIIAFVPAVLAGLVLLLAWALSPRRHSA